MSAGFLNEVIALRAHPKGLSRTAAQALGYRELLAHLRGETSLDEALELATNRTRQFARRQRSWFGRDPRITWLDAATTTPPDLAAHLRQCVPHVKPIASARPGPNPLPRVN